MKRAFVVGLVGLSLLTGTFSLPVAAADEGAQRYREQFLNGSLGWEAVEERARQEGTVTWFHWGGSEKLNNWIERKLVPKLLEKGITLQTSRIANTRDAVDLVLTELQAGRQLGEGSVDMIWLNGDNFYTLAQQNALFGAFADKLPNSRHFAFDPADSRAQLNLADFGTPTLAREMPWSGEQYVCYIDTARLARSEAPVDFISLESWLRDHPGRFTYVKPPHYIGNTFVQTVLYAFAPNEQGYRPFQQPLSDFTPAEFAALVAPGFVYLRRIEPFLLGGETPVYPPNQQANQARFNSGEVDIACEFGLYLVDRQRETGAFAETVETVIFPSSGMIKNKNFLAIPENAPHPAAALVLANILSGPDMQISKLREIGYPLGIDLFLLPDDVKKSAMAAAPPHHGVSAGELAAAAVPDTNASLVKVIEKIWITYIERRSHLPFEQIVAEAMSAG